MSPPLSAGLQFKHAQERNSWYLSPFVDLFYEDSHHGLHTLVYEGLYVLHSLFLIQIQAELVLDLEGREREAEIYSHDDPSSLIVLHIHECTHARTHKHTHLLHSLVWLQGYVRHSRVQH